MHLLEFLMSTKPVIYNKYGCCYVYLKFTLDHVITEEKNYFV